MNSGVVIPVSVRAVRPEDEVRFRRMWPRLSAETVYRRFHAAVRRLPDDLLRFLVVVDHDLREAVVAVVGDEVVGVARYDRPPLDPSVAEVAVVVEDGWQGAGIGRQLLDALTALAAERGVTTLTARVQPDNDAALWLARRLLPGAIVTSDGDVLLLEATLVPAVTAGTGPLEGAVR
ncbi:GNAT family N-acetyltransferase [Blastococcus sp. TF02-8]|uniref:GNAT family N-acetyltransferase n=1 Tax=Blastococcus sp. TF02-8 TaxID=2250574 RepID=UPI000DE99F17|nr:GNAT family N-acetyltransferase [Blastococcus sp. TF02-8]RBY96332.1 GNAT family N-acetyltransferase [Blastococcus sp. TF02-8]